MVEPPEEKFNIGDDPRVDVSAAAARTSLREILLMHAQLERGSHLAPTSGRVVSEIMTPCAHALPEEAPVAFAISLLAFESQYEVPIVSKDGRVLGVATALDILRWLAVRMGYDLARGTTLKIESEQR
jgi:CBS-domain-containing membrane protein